MIDRVKLALEQFERMSPDERTALTQKIRARHAEAEPESDGQSYWVVGGVLDQQSAVIECQEPVFSTPLVEYGTHTNNLPSVALRESESFRPTSDATIFIYRPHNGNRAA
jgi:hypothetical protein